MRLVVCVFDTGKHPKRIVGSDLDCSSLNSMRRRDMLEGQSASDTKQVVSGIINSHLRIGESCTRVTFGEVERLGTLMLFGKTFIDLMLIQSTRPKEISSFTASHLYLF